jgi:hypothetical protein
MEFGQNKPIRPCRSQCVLPMWATSIITLQHRRVLGSAVQTPTGGFSPGSSNQWIANAMRGA